MAEIPTGFTQSDLDALESAIATGVKIVKYTDKVIEYRSLKEMLEIRDRMRQSLGLGSKTTRLKGRFSKGLC